MAVNVTIVPVQIIFPVLTAMVALAAGLLFTVMVIGFDVAWLVVKHEAFDVITQEITSPLISVVVVD